MAEEILTLDMLKVLSPNQRKAALDAGLVSPDIMKVAGGMLTGDTATGPVVNLGQGSEYHAYMQKLKAEELFNKLMIKKSMDAEAEKNSPMNKLKQTYQQGVDTASGYIGKMLSRQPTP